MIITIITFIVFATFISAFIILIRTVNVFKSPSEIKYKIEYIDIEKSKIWMMENQQKDYDKKTHDKKIYFFMSDNIINNETEISLIFLRIKLIISMCTKNQKNYQNFGLQMKINLFLI